jgi:hypothetical protein
MGSEALSAAHFICTGQAVATPSRLRTSGAKHPFIHMPSWRALEKRYAQFYLTMKTKYIALRKKSVLHSKLAHSKLISVRYVLILFSYLHCILLRRVLHIPPISPI